jgi:carbonic anhydrase/acetyltransferase-like protein (isoleucine patch superfamily)
LDNDTLILLLCHDNATLIGDVVMGDSCSVWFHVLKVKDEATQDVGGTSV